MRNKEMRNSEMSNMTSLGIIRRITIGVALVAVAVAGSCASDGEKEPAASDSSEPIQRSIVVADVWARASMAGANSAIYMSIDGGGSDDRLLKISTQDEIADSVEIHETTLVEPGADGSGMDGSGADGSGMDGSGDSGHGPDATDQHSTSTSPGGKMRTMRPVDAIDVPAGQRVELAPGGFHVMLMNLHSDLLAGDRIAITLTFEHAGDISAEAEVKEP